MFGVFCRYQSHSYGMRLSALKIYIGSEMFQKPMNTSVDVQGIVEHHSLYIQRYFSNSKLTLFQILMIMYSWSMDCTQVESMVDSYVNKYTMVEWYNFYCDIYAMCYKARTYRRLEVKKIVEINELKFGKQEYH